MVVESRWKDSGGTKIELVHNDLGAQRVLRA